MLYAPVQNGARAMTTSKQWNGRGGVREPAEEGRRFRGQAPLQGRGGRQAPGSAGIGGGGGNRHHCGESVAGGAGTLGGMQVWGLQALGGIGSWGTQVLGGQRQGMEVRPLAPV